MKARFVPASTGAAPAPAPEPLGEPEPRLTFVDVQVSKPPSVRAALALPTAYATLPVRAVSISRFNALEFLASCRLISESLPALLDAC